MVRVSTISLLIGVGGVVTADDHIGGCNGMIEGSEICPWMHSDSHKTRLENVYSGDAMAVWGINWQHDLLTIFEIQLLVKITQACLQQIYIRSSAQNSLLG
jgi:hypothetical protein